MAVVSERNRIARDLHDSITQTLFSANLIAETINAAWNEDRTKALDLIGELRQLNQGALAEMRTLLLELRPASVIETDFDELLEQLANVLRGRANCQVKVKVKGICRLPEDVHVGLYRIAQEAVTNIMKHAGAQNVRIQLICSSSMIDDLDVIEEVKLIIEDDGKGFDHDLVTGSRFGLVNMQQRASAIGAVLKVEAQPGLGTSITVIWKEREDIQGNE
jgi:two-component system nitrate/nitrite sensor histidine kinase NarX